MAAAQLTHPSRATLEAFLSGRLEDREQSLVETHVSHCDSCCDVLRRVPRDEIVERLRLVETSSPGETQVLPQPVETELETDAAAIPAELAHHARYRILQQLGAGGMGVVYQAEHRVMERAVALKVIHHRLVSNPLAVERFHQEVKAAARLTHRNIVTAYDAEQAGNLHFLVMEFVEGMSLADLVKRRGPLPVQHAANYMLQAAMGLAHAHEHKMVHRDIKPQNLMRTPKGVVKVLDFGLARFACQQQAEESGLTTAGATVGTPDYISPEQARDSRRADIRSDIYSLGCTFYYLLTGRPPFPKGTAIEKFIAHSEHEPTSLTELRSDIPLDVLYVVERMMAKDPAKRYQTPAELVEALKPLGKPGATIEQPTIAALEKSTTATDLPVPLEQLDALAAQQSLLAAPLLQSPWQYPEPRRSINWHRLLRRHGKTLAGAGGALAVLIAGLWLVPVVRDLVASGDEPENPRSGAGGLVKAEAPSQKPEAASKPTWAAGQPFDALPKIDPARDAVLGNWYRDGYALKVDAEPNKGALLALPGTPSAEYDLEVKFKRTSGNHSIAIIFAAGAGQATLEFDCWGQGLSGIQSIGGRDLRGQSGAKVLPLSNGRHYVALLKVRRGRVEAYLDDKLLQVYEGDGSDLTLFKSWQLPDSKKIGLGAYASSAEFHCVRVRQVW